MFCVQAMARDNPQVQQRLFERLDLLLGVDGSHEERARTLTEVNHRIIFSRWNKAEVSQLHVLVQVFTGNKGNCLSIHFQDIRRIVELAASHTSRARAGYLELLKAIVKVEELDLPLKRNQDYVMKYFTQNRAAFDAMLDCDNKHRSAGFTFSHQQQTA